jgi:hypothetical protein
VFWYDAALFTFLKVTEMEKSKWDRRDFLSFAKPRCARPLVSLTPGRNHHAEKLRRDAVATGSGPIGGESTYDTDYFGDFKQQWMVNFRVRNLDAMLMQLRAAGIKVDLDPNNYPNGRFARLYDPDRKSSWLWEPAGRDAPR